LTISGLIQLLELLMGFKGAVGKVPDSSWGLLILGLDEGSLPKGGGDRTLLEVRVGVQD
jgi:hypothetical protein